MIRTFFRAYSHIKTQDRSHAVQCEMTDTREASVLHPLPFTQTHTLELTASSRTAHTVVDVF